jgi:preprotein translocase subunit SecB
MSTESVNDARPAQQPQMSVLSQYVRQHHFDNAAAKNGNNPAGKPAINVQVNVENKNVGDNRYTVTLATKVTAESDGKSIFSIDLDYVGVFQLSNIPEANLSAILSIECPRLLFPFARRIIAESSRDGGFPPLMLDPIDFASLFRQQMARRTAQKGETDAA